ncbi:MAG: hypothetical protein ACOC3V_03585 [bacterium]
MKFKHFFTGWRAKQIDKFHLKLRIMNVDIISVKFDVSRKKYEFIILNTGITNY